jgi:hypothetical protein
MKQISLLISLILGNLICFGQGDSTKYYFPEIGMTVYVPKEFKLQDPEPTPEYLGEGSQPITDSAIIKQMTKNNPKILLEIESLDKKNKLSIRLIPTTDGFMQLFGDSVEYINMSKRMIIALTRQATEKFDTLFSKTEIGKHTAYKLFSISSIQGHDFYQGGYFIKLENYYLSISLFFQAGENGDKLMKIIETAKLN